MRSEKREGRFRPNWSFIFRFGITATILGYLGSKIHWAELGTQLTQCDPFWLLTAFLLIGIAFLLGSVRWWLMLKVQEIFVPFRVAVALTLIGQFFNSFLLGSTGGDIIKTLYILKYTSFKKARATLSVILDRIMGLFVFMGCALFALPWQFRLLMQREETKAIIYAVLILFGFTVAIALALSLIPFQRLPIFFHQIWGKIPRRDLIESLIGGFRQHRRSPRLTFEAIVQSVVASLAVFAAGYCIALAIRLNVSFMQILTILAVVICVISLPISIGGHGIREGVFVLMFTVFGIITIDNQTGAGQEPAILFSLLFFALFSGWSLVGGLVYLTYKSDIENQSAVSQIVPVGDDTGGMI